MSLNRHTSSESSMTGEVVWIHKEENRKSWALSGYTVTRKTVSDLKSKFLS